MAASTVALASNAIHNVPKPFAAGLVGNPFAAASIATTSLDDIGDTVELGYLPGNCTLLGFLVQATSMAASGLVVKIQVNGVDYVTGITTLVAGGGALFFANAPLVIPNGGPQKVQMLVTTVATTPAAGTLYLTPIYANN